MIFDLEADGLYEDVTKIHCVSFSKDFQNVTTITSPQEIKNFFTNAKVLIGHDVCRYDLRVVKKLYGITTKAKLYDTLPMSWVMNEGRASHGLESFGKDFNIPKPIIKDWENLSQEEYIHRCEEDVKINLKLWNNLITKFKLLYNDKETLDRYLQYLTFKMQCAAEQLDVGWKLDVAKAKEHLKKLEELEGPKLKELEAVMPKVKKYSERVRPDKTHKKDGTLTERYKKWLDLLDFYGLPKDHVGTIREVSKEDPPNGGSPVQVKNWLMSIGWHPCTFDYKKEANGKERKIPLVRKFGQLTPSVLALAEENPEVNILKDLGIIQHRIGIFKGFLDSVDEKGYLRAEISGLTNTLRFKHSKPIVNLPGVDKPWGKEVRECLIAQDENHTQCGSDMVSLEATTKAHYMYPHDPEYAKALTARDFDEHLDLAEQSGALTHEQVINHKKGIEDYSGIRKQYKPVNYSAVYGIGKDKLARENRFTLKKAEKLLDDYWVRNWAIKEVAKEQVVKRFNNRMWLKNPVNGFWYSLRFEKDVFSTLNQGTGSFCFDTWVAFCRSKGVKLCGQFHDEQINPVKKGKEEQHTKILKWAEDKLNEKLKLNVRLEVDINYGRAYSEIH